MTKIKSNLDKPGKKMRLQPRAAGKSSSQGVCLKLQDSKGFNNPTIPVSLIMITIHIIMMIIHIIIMMMIITMIIHIITMIISLTLEGTEQLAISQQSWSTLQELLSGGTNIVIVILIMSILIMICFDQFWFWFIQMMICSISDSAPGISSCRPLVSQLSAVENLLKFECKVKEKYIKRIINQKCKPFEIQM